MTIVVDNQNTNKLLATLNSEQQKAVAHKNGPLLVLAGAGSGKTRVLTHRAAWFINQGVASESILLLTFTNKAANEMKARVEKLTSKSPTFAGTFHSFSAKLLRIDGQKVGVPNNFLIYDSQDTRSAIGQIIADLGIGDSSVKPASIAAAISEAKNQMLSPLEYAEFAKGNWQETIFKVYLAYEKFLTEVGALDFDDLIIKAVKLLAEDLPTRTKWQQKLTHILVDEWQDTNKAQYQLTKLVVGDKKNITAVGDASQSIYSWRGADYKNIEYLMRDYPDLTIVNLERNYRSTQNILSAANSIIAKNASHPVLKLWTDKSAGEKIKIYRARNGLDEASFVVSEIERLCARRAKFSDVAILYRTNAQSRVIEEALLHAGIPYVLVGGLRFYERAEVKDVVAYLKLLENNKDLVSQKRIEKLGKKRLQEFEALKSELTNIKDYSTLELLDNILKRTDYLTKFQRETEENLQRLENIKELRSVATEFPTISDFLENIALMESEQLDGGRIKRQSVDSNHNAVTLMTLHAAKGLEFPIVFMVGMEEGLFPHSRSLFELSQLEEERRLAYVGMTRAKDVLYLTFADNRLYFGQGGSNPPSRFLGDVPEELLEGISSKKESATY